MKIKFVIYCLFAFAFGFSQTHTATISDVKKDGFHKITISPEVRSASQDNLGYLRILDKRKKEVPYVVFVYSYNATREFEPLEIQDKMMLKDSISEFTIEVRNFKSTTELYLFISNTKINKTYSISGSNNKSEWFGLVSNEVLSDLNNNYGTSVEKSISLPQNNYKFLKIQFNDKNSLPINVLKIGSFRDNKKSAETTYVSDFKYKISEDKKNKKTIITFSSDNFQKVDGISFDVKTKYFSRNASVYLYKKRKVKKYFENFKEKNSNFYLNSNASNIFQLNGFFEKEFTIEIDNQDNQPLEISKIKVFQNEISVITDLKTNEKYEVIIDSTLSKPNYDLVNFTQNISTELPEATISNLKKLDAESKDTSEKSFWEKPIFLWSVILLTILLLAYFVRSLLKDIKAN